MKKLIFSLAIMFVTLYSFAQINPIQKPTGVLYQKDTCPCQVVTHENLPMPTEVPIWSPAPRVEKIYIAPKQPTNSNVNSFNHTTTGSHNTTTTNNNYYGYRPNMPGYNNYYDNGWNWLLPWLCLGLLVWFIFWLVNREHTSDKTSGGGGMKIDLHNHMPAQPKNQVVVPATVEEIDKGMNAAKETGGTFTKGGDGGYTVSFPKPEPVKKEDIKPDAEQPAK